MCAGYVAFDVSYYDFIVFYISQNAELYDCGPRQR